MACGGWFGAGGFFETAVGTKEVSLQVCDCVQDALASVEELFCR